MAGYEDYLRSLVQSEPARMAGAAGAGAQELIGNIGRYGMHALNRGAQTISGAGNAWNGYFDNNEQKIDDWWDNPPVLPDSYNQYRQGLIEENPMAADAGQIVAGGIAAQPFKLADSYRTGQGPYARMMTGKAGYNRRRKMSQNMKGKPDREYARYQQQLKDYNLRREIGKMTGLPVKAGKRPEPPKMKSGQGSARTVYGKKAGPNTGSRKEPKLDSYGRTKSERAGVEKEFEAMLGTSIQRAASTNMVGSWLNDAQVHKQLKREKKGQEVLQGKFNQAAGETEKYNNHLKEMYKLYRKTGDDRYLYDQ